jgi:hypothetical protein
MTPPDQLPAILTPGALTTPTDGPLIPALIGNLGEAIAWRYVEFRRHLYRGPAGCGRRAEREAAACGQSPKRGSHDTKPDHLQEHVK